MRYLPLTAIAVLGLSACANTGADYTPIVDGPYTTGFSTDLDACQKVAERRSYTNGDVQSEAAFGAVTTGLVTGLIAGIEDGDVGSGIAGALIGGAIGGVAAGVGQSWDTSGERKNIVVSCMQGRGHNVVG